MAKANPKSLVVTIVLALAGTLSVLCGGCGRTSQNIILQGSGATFPAPLYKRWFVDYYAQHPTVRTGYLVEYGDTQTTFDSPRERPTQEYLRGEFS